MLFQNYLQQGRWLPSCRLRALQFLFILLQFCLAEMDWSYCCAQVTFVWKLCCLDNEILKLCVNAPARGLTQSYLQAVLQSRRQWNPRKSWPSWPVCHVSNIDTRTGTKIWTWRPIVSKITQDSSLILSNVQKEWSVEMFFLSVL